jgi:hypothetical protein
MLISRMLSATMIAGAPEPRGSAPAAAPSSLSRLRAPLRRRVRPGSRAGIGGAQTPPAHPLGRAPSVHAHR